MAIMTTGPETTMMYVKYLSSWYRCGNGVVSSNDYHNWYNDCVTKSVDLVKPDQRPRPAEPLWKYPTYYPAVYNEKTVYGIETYSNVYPRIISCYGRQTRYDDYKVVYNDMGSLIYPNPRTHWELALRLKIEEETVNLGVAMAEYRQTCTMFGDLGLGMVRAYKRIRGKLPRKQRKLFRTTDLPAAYLQYTYGIAPLVNDTFEAYLALQLASTRELWRRAVITKKDDATYVYTTPSGRELTAISKLSERAIVYYQLDPETPTTVGTPVEWIWETIPYSFVLDWIVNVGDILNSLDALRGVKALTGSLVIKTQENASVKPLPGRESERLNTHERTSFTREILSHSNIPLPSLTPRYEPSQSVKAVVNGLALLTQIRRNDVQALANQVKSTSRTNQYKRRLAAILETEKANRKKRRRR